MFYFPRRPINKTGFYRRRSFQDDIPRYEDVVLHYRADECYTDGLDFSVPCDVGQNIESTRDLSVYARHAIASGSTRYLYVLDSGFPAIQTNGALLQTVASFQAAMQIVVFRSASPGWTGHGAVFGRLPDSRQYMFHSSGTGFSTAPLSVQRQNGVAQTPGNALSNITAPMVFTAGHQAAAVVSQWYIGRIAAFSNSLFIYEILAFSSILPVEDIAQIEAYLMDKYGIEGGS
jgi:hypothetical protein